LLAVAQRGVKYYNAVFTHRSVFPGPPILRVGFNKKPHRGDAAGGVSKFTGITETQPPRRPRAAPAVQVAIPVSSCVYVNRETAEGQFE
jgi:hypothetical protein